MCVFIKSFFREESGAVTVDWVVITAAVVLLAGVSIASLQAASGGLGNAVGENLTDTEVGN